MQQKVGKKRKCIDSGAANILLNFAQSHNPMYRMINTKLSDIFMKLPREYSTDG